MNQARYDVIFNGAIADGLDIAIVKVRIAKLFNTNASQVERLFGGSTVVIKRQTDEQTARKYYAAMRQAGALCQIRPCASAEKAGEQPQVTATMPRRAGPTGGISIAAPGSLLVEHPHVPEREFDLSAYSMAAVGADVLEHQPSPEVPEIDLSGYDLDPPGIELVEAPASPPPPDLDTSDYSVAARGEDLVEHPLVVAQPLPDTDGLSMAPAGSDVLKPEEIKPAPPPPQVGDNLGLEPVSRHFPGKGSDK
jgi:hypothetical protein